MYIYPFAYMILPYRAFINIVEKFSMLRCSKSGGSLGLVGSNATRFASNYPAPHIVRGGILCVGFFLKEPALVFWQGGVVEA